ncbi:MAG: metal-dependent hydrolase [Kiritimatiellae bacterium]|nr:metal-dependent hydrolase [Kiritimatiellia bacterium]
MKGFSHFMSGVAVASFCPWSIEAALNGNPVFFVLGGACGILPDTLDFKFYRFFYRHDVYVEPDPIALDPQAIADEVARAVNMGVDERRYIRLKLSSIRLGADYWQQYTVDFDNENMEVVVRFGPVTNTGQVPVPGTAEKNTKVGRAKIKAKVIQTYDSSLKVDIFDGPTAGLAPREDGNFDLEFLPWHREWSHALTIGFFLGLLWLLGCTLFGNWLMGVQGLILMTGCYGIHVIEDQLGHMGSNLFYPFTKHRVPGLHWMHSGDGLPNFLAVWISCIFIFWNLHRSMEAPQYHFGLLQLFWVALIAPGLIFWGLRWLLTRKQGTDQLEADDAADEWNDMKSGN